MMDKELFRLSIAERAKKEQEEKDRQARLKNSQYLKEEANADILDMKKKRMSMREARIKAPDAIKTSLVYEFVNMMYESVLAKLNISDTGCLRYNLINNYIQENGAINIVNRYKTASEFLSEVAYSINKHTAIIIEEKLSDKEETITITIDDEQKQSFLDSLDNDNIDQLANKISERVQQAQIEFLSYNQQDKEHIEKIIDVTQEKINGTVKESLIDIYEKDCKAAINMVRHNRPKSIYEYMVNNICKQTYNSDILKEQFLTENSKLDLDAITETATIIYTFLEMSNTIKLEDINESYIRKVYSDLTK